MAERGALGTYVDNLRTQGYKDDQISSYLLQQGYSQDQVKDAMGRGPPWVLLIFIFFLVLLIAGGAAYFMLSAPSPNLSVKIQVKQVEIRQGGQLGFSFTVFGAKSPQTSVRVTDAGGRTANPVVVLSGNAGNIAIGETMAPGKYTVVLDAEADGKKTSGTASFIVLENKDAATKDKPKEDTAPPEETPKQNETPAENPPLESLPTGEQACEGGCNDYDECTTDTCSEGSCKYSAKPKPCCGDFVCEGDETSVTCAMDCTDRPELPPTEDTINLANQTYKKDRGKAMKLCAALLTIRDKDLCFSTVSIGNKDVSACTPISTDGKRDTCLMNFVLKEKNYAICGKINNPMNKDVCESLANLNRLQNEAQAMDDAQSTG